MVINNGRIEQGIDIMQADVQMLNICNSILHLCNGSADGILSPHNANTLNVKIDANVSLGE